jgi:2-iminoacetate synthase
MKDILFDTVCTDVLRGSSWDHLAQKIDGCGGERVSAVLAGADCSVDDLWILLSPAAGERLEEMAQRAHRLTLQRFGRTILLYAPLYVSNYCINQCKYCGFNIKNTVSRRCLTVDEAYRESMLLHAQGFRHILLVSGEHPDYAHAAYLAELAEKLRHEFSSVCIEVQPLSQDEYSGLIEHGVDCVTCYQETYNPATYAAMHPGGPKSDYYNRLNTLDRAAAAGIRKVGLSPLYGLDDWRVEALMVGLHARHLETRYWQTQVCLSFPRLQRAAGAFDAPYPLDDRSLTQLICAMRLVFPDAHLILSTRETARLRDQVLPLGITQMSAGSRTAPQGYSHDHEAGEQFDVMDQRTANEVAMAIAGQGYEPVWKDWDEQFLVQMH